mgnify:FL=1
MKYLAITCGALALSASPFALSRPAAAQDVIDLGEIVISGGLTPVSAEVYGRAYDTVDADEIDRRGHADVVEALRTQPGFTASIGGLNEFRIRGAEANHILILVDGVEVQLPADGSYELGNLNVGEIARIEVLRGPQSALWGSAAMSGVVSITTRGAGEQTGASGRAEVAAGTDSHLSASVGLSTRGARGFLALNASTTSDRGYDLSQDVDGTTDPRRATSFRLRGEYEPTQWLTLGGSLRRVERVEAFDDTAFPFEPGDPKEDYVVDGDNTRRDTETTGSLYAVAEQMDGQLRHELRYSTLDGDRVFEFGGFPSAQSFGRRQARYKVSYGFDGPAATARQLVTAMAEWEEARYDNDFIAEEKRRATRSVALEYRGAFDNGLSLQAGLRHDDNEDFRDVTTWSVSAAWDIPGSGTRLRAGAGTGQVNPTFIEQFGFSGDFVGNPDLKPESLSSWEVGIEQELLDGRGEIALTWFDQRITDRIATEETAGGDDRAVNIGGDSTQRGVELSARLQATDAVRLDLAYTWTDADDPDGSATIRVPEHVVDLAATWTAPGGAADVTVGMRHVAGNTGRDQGTARKVALDDYTTVDMGVRYRVTEATELFGQVNNLFDTDYEEQWGYPARGRTMRVGLRTRF